MYVEISVKVTHKLDLTLGYLPRDMAKTMVTVFDDFSGTLRFLD